MSKFIQYLTESKLPTKFKSGEAFMNYVYDRWPSKETYVEHQGGGAWLAEIDGDSKIKQAVYDAQNKLVSWQDAEGEEI